MHGSFVVRLRDESEHFKLVDAVNAARTTIEHRLAQARLSGWRDGVRAAGAEPDLCACDVHALPGLLEMTDAEVEAARPCCCGEFLDWTPAEGEV